MMRPATNTGPAPGHKNGSGDLLARDAGHDEITTPCGLLLGGLRLALVGQELGEVVAGLGEPLVVDGQVAVA